MDYKNYLLTQSPVDLACVAERMWPKNKSAKTYLSRKLNGTDGRRWTEKDNDLAEKALHSIGHELINLPKRPDKP